MGWGEIQGPSAEMVRRAEERRKADDLAAAVDTYLRKPSTGNCDRLAVAHVAYETVRRG